MTSFITFVVGLMIGHWIAELLPRPRQPFRGCILCGLDETNTYFDKNAALECDCKVCDICCDRLIG